MMDDSPPLSRKMNRRHWIALCGLSTSLTGCLAKAPDGGREIETISSSESHVDPDVSPESVTRLVKDLTGFTVDLYRQLRESEQENNVFFSPYSVSIAIAMAYAGAEGKTETQIREALRWTLDEETLHPAFNRLSRLIEENPVSGEESTTTATGSDEPVPLRIRVANAIWGQQGFPFEESYLEIIAKHYGSGLQTVNFTGNAKAARESINEWVRNETEGKISELVGPESVTEMTRLVLTNAIYFQASWKSPFNPEKTAAREFTGIDDSTAQMPMMEKTASLPHAEVDGHQIVKLPYVKSSASMVVILPAEGEFVSLRKSLNPKRFTTFTDALSPSEGRLVLPKFEYATSLSLPSELSAMGMSHAFKPESADFSGMYDEKEVSQNLYLQDVIHTAFVAVDEQGTEAAAATAASAGIVSTGPSSPWEMIVDRPFLFFIQDEETDTIIFAGDFSTPKQAE